VIALQDSLKTIPAEKSVFHKGKARGRKSKNGNHITALGQKSFCNPPEQGYITSEAEYRECEGENLFDGQGRVLASALNVRSLRAFLRHAKARVFTCLNFDLLALSEVQAEFW